MLLSILRRKTEVCGGCLAEVNTKRFRTSQYNHVEDTYTKAGREVRWKDIGGRRVQRDLYSAFLIRCSNPEGTAPDRDLCSARFGAFVTIHDKLIKELKDNGISRRACFGF